MTSSASASSVGGIFEAERLGGLEVDDKLEFGRPYHRQLGHLRTLQNPAGVDAGLAIGIGKTGSVTDQAASRNKLALNVDRRHRMSCRQRHDLVAPADEERITSNDECTNPLLHKRREGRIDFAFRAGVKNDHVARGCTRGRLCLRDLSLGTRKFRVNEQGHYGSLGYQLVQQLEPFRS